VYENRVLRRTFLTKIDEETGDWTKLKSDEIHTAYYSCIIIRTIEDAMSEESSTLALRIAFMVLLEKNKWKRALGKAWRIILKRILWK
jgi:hypothetical protein